MLRWDCVLSSAVATGLHTCGRPIRALAVVSGPMRKLTCKAALATCGRVLLARGKRSGWSDLWYFLVNNYRPLHDKRHCNVTIILHKSSQGNLNFAQQEMLELGL